MRILISVASRHGSTADIGRAIADVLIDHEIDAWVISPEDVDSIES